MNQVTPKAYGRAAPGYPERPKSAFVQRFEGRMRWWYPAIADLMISNPHLTLTAIAAQLGKHLNTVSAIVQTDGFRAYLAGRRAAWEERHDAAISNRLNGVAEASLDILLEQLETKRSAIPVSQVMNIAVSALDRLGYAPAAASQPAVQVNVGPQFQTVDPGLLRDARDKMRQVEGSRVDQPQNSWASTAQPPAAVESGEGEHSAPPAESEAPTATPSSTLAQPSNATGLEEP